MKEENTMKKEAYEPVEIEVIAFDAEDVIMTSDEKPNKYAIETPDLA